MLVWLLTALVVDGLDVWGGFIVPGRGAFLVNGHFLRWSRDCGGGLVVDGICSVWFVVVIHWTLGWRLYNGYHGLLLPPLRQFCV